ncbi:hypothetical protein HW35_09000 [Bacillus sp. X1(2014)]|nr:hypothetical protein HW35_09000 [Bacillus sp. X1(2014)]
MNAVMTGDESFMKKEVLAYNGDPYETSYLKNPKQRGLVYGSCFYLLRNFKNRFVQASYWQDIFERQKLGGRFYVCLGTSRKCMAVPFT